jgi:hypothetical protein
VIRGKIEKYYRGMTGDHHRYRSWEHCFRYFQTLKSESIAADWHCAALQLGFYLASWGMYRGSSFLLQYAYTVHLGVIQQLVDPRFSVLWEREFGAHENDKTLIPTVLEAVNTIREAYRPFARQATDTLVTKIMLGTFGCLPACDRYFIDGFKSATFKYSRVNKNFVGQALDFCLENLGDLRDEQQRIEYAGGMRYPLMKLVDMYFWQIGCDLAGTANVDVFGPSGSASVPAKNILGSS